MRAETIKQVKDERDALIRTRDRLDREIKALDALLNTVDTPLRAVAPVVVVEQEAPSKPRKKVNLLHTPIQDAIVDVLLAADGPLHRNVVMARVADAGISMGNSSKPMNTFASHANRDERVVMDGKGYWSLR